MPDEFIPGTQLTQGQTPGWWRWKSHQDLILQNSDKGYGENETRKMEKGNEEEREAKMISKKSYRGGDAWDDEAVCGMWKMGRHQILKGVTALPEVPLCNEMQQVFKNIM